ncbi:MAG: FkbM family methyltransferase [Verrucomicrobiia bacterium]|jgi:FkbM family methyltransferase
MGLKSKVQKIFQTAKKIFCKNPDDFLRKARGVVHVGANEGQERDLYAKHKLNVLWIEPIPDIFNILKKNIINYPEQIAYQYLIADKDDVEYTFHIANNQGASSSIYDIKLHKDIWPEVSYQTSIKLKSITLSTLIKKESINLSNYDALVIDTQGSELLVLKGTEPILDHFRFIKIEVPDFEAYASCSQLKDVHAFLTARGFKEYTRHKFAEHPQGGAYYELLFIRKN